jgi:hypothetical protein
MLKPRQRFWKLGLGMLNAVKSQPEPLRRRWLGRYGKSEAYLKSGNAMCTARVGSCCQTSPSASFTECMTTRCRLLRLPIIGGGPVTGVVGNPLLNRVAGGVYPQPPHHHGMRVCTWRFRRVGVVIEKNASLAPLMLLCLLRVRAMGSRSNPHRSREHCAIKPCNAAELEHWDSA